MFVSCQARCDPQKLTRSDNHALSEGVVCSSHVSDVWPLAEKKCAYMVGNSYETMHTVGAAG